jgi:hypothetical protein
MTELTYEEFCALPLQYTMGMTTATGAFRMYRNEQFKIQKEVNTKRKRFDDIYGGWEKQTIAFFLDGDGRQFDTLEQVYMAYMQKVCGIEETA